MARAIHRHLRPDFVPPPFLLERFSPGSDEQLAFVQARWNRRDGSLLTVLQSSASTVRGGAIRTQPGATSRTSMHGRRLAAAGDRGRRGWSFSTLTEDLDLGVALRYGWRPVCCRMWWRLPSW
jgi:hypothetical protein